MKPNGFGTFTYGKGPWRGDKYKGMWKDGKFNREGTLTRKNGERFEGLWIENNVWNISKYNKLGKILRKYENGLEVPIKSKIKIKQNN